MGAVLESCNGRLDVNHFEGVAVKGSGGELQPITGRTVCLLVCFDYKQNNSKFPPLSASTDGKRIADLAAACNVELLAYFDKDEKNFPRKDVIRREWRRLASELTEEDAFVFYFSGHGIQLRDKDGDEDDGFDEAMLFVEPDGRGNPFVDDEVAELLVLMNPKTRVVAITDCCHSGSMLDLSRPKLHGRPIFHLAASRDHQQAVDLGGGGAFTTCLLETLKRTRHDEREKSVTEIYNTIVGKYQKRYANDDQTFELSFPIGADPDTCPWPTQPSSDWTVVTQFDGQVYMMNTGIYVPGMQGAKMIRKIGADGKLIESAKKKVDEFAGTGLPVEKARTRSGIGGFDFEESIVPVCRPTPVYKAAPGNYSLPAPIGLQPLPTLLGHGSSTSINVNRVRYG